MSPKRGLPRETSLKSHDFSVGPPVLATPLGCRPTPGQGYLDTGQPPITLVPSILGAGVLAPGWLMEPQNTQLRGCRQG